MAYYYSSNYQGNDYGEYNFNSYGVNYYDYAQNPNFLAYNGYGFNQPYYGYDQSLYYSPNYPNSNYSTISYSATTFSDPKLIEYDPNLGMSQLVISYSNLEFNQPEFEDYDPTPYSGGYDITQTYGKPLPPSEEICYPHSEKISAGVRSDAIPVDAIVPLPNVEEEIHDREKAIVPQNGSAGQMTGEMPEPQDNSRDLQEEEELRSRETQDLIPYENEDSKDNYYSGSGYGNGYGNEYERVPPQYPGGYGLEAVDLCESLFGYWPCLAKMKRGNCCHDVVNEEGYNCKENMWKGTADYLFGSPNPYGGRGDDGSGYGGETVYAYDYERHYPTQSQYLQIEYHEDS